MHALCIPAPFLPLAVPRSHSQFDQIDVINANDNDSDIQATRPNSDEAAFADADALEIHLHTLHGLDVSKPALEMCAYFTAPPSPSPSSSSEFESTENSRSHITAAPRWEPLEVSLWHGGLEAFNERFVGAECIVSTEVCVSTLPSDAYSPSRNSLH